MQKELYLFHTASDAGTAASLAEEFKTFANDFCDNYAGVLPQRTGLVSALKDIEDASAFNTACFEA